MADAADTEQASPRRKIFNSKEAMASIRRAQERGDWPQRKNPTAPKEPIAEPSDYDPAKKLFPTEEERAKVLSSVPATEETIPPEIKRELTEEARKLNTMAMAGTEETSETQQPQVQSPYGPPTPEKVQARQEGVNRFKKIMEAQKEVKVAKSGASQPKPLETKTVASAPSSEPTPPPAPKTPASTAEEPGDARPFWLRKQAQVVEQEKNQAAVGQIGQKKTPSIAEQRAQRAVEQLIETKTQPPPAPLPTTEQVAAQQSVQKGQEIKKRWSDRIPFLNILRGKRQ